MKYMCVNSALEAVKVYVYLIKSQSARFNNHTKPYRDMIYIEYCRSDFTQTQQSLGMVQSSFQLPLLVDWVAEVVQHSHNFNAGFFSFIQLLEWLGHP